MPPSDLLLTSHFDTFLADCKTLGIAWQPAQLQQLAQFYDLLSATNQHTNLTRISEPQDFLYRHVLNSLSLLPYLSENIRLADIGSGGGFPALPLAIIRPDLRITAVESVGKKASFIEATGQALQLKNLHVLNERSEILGQSPQYREQFDCVTARALAPLPVLLELTLPLLKPQRHLLAMKGPKAADEIESAKRAMKLLHARVIQHVPAEPSLLEGSVILVIEKTAPTPKAYPRQAGMPKKKPL